MVGICVGVLGCEIYADAAKRGRLLSGRDQCFFYLGRLAEYLGLGDLTLTIEELSDGKLIADLERAVSPVSEFTTKKFVSPLAFRLYRLAQYAIVRQVKPSIFVETGVMHGLTSAFILAALDRNGHGRLISIDLPSYPERGPSNRDGYAAVLPRGQQPGWVVAPNQRWELMLGRSDDLLPKVAAAHSQWDVFSHDSDHSYGVMWNELTFAWPHVRPGGIMIVDNIDTSPAFFDFCRRVSSIPLVLPAPDSARHEPARFAIIRKGP